MGAVGGVERTKCYLWTYSGTNRTNKSCSETVNTCAYPTLIKRLQIERFGDVTPCVEYSRAIK